MLQMLHDWMLQREICLGTETAINLVFGVPVLAGQRHKCVYLTYALFARELCDVFTQLCSPILYHLQFSNQTSHKQMNILNIKLCVAIQLSGGMIHDATPRRRVANDHSD